MPVADQGAALSANRYQLVPRVLCFVTSGPEVLLLKAVGLVAWVLPYLLILGAPRKALQDLFSRSIVIRVDH